MTGDVAAKSDTKPSEPSVGAADEDSTFTVVLALLANFGIAVAKGLAGALSGSAAMLSESAHSVGDTVNEVMLLLAVRRSTRSPDRRHPFGYGKERYFWALLAAVGIFVGGAVFSVVEGVQQLLKGGTEGGHYLLEYVILGVSAILEGSSWLRSIQQLRQAARRMSRRFRRQVFDTTDPSTTTVLFEDSAALVGLVIAAAGIGLHQATGQKFWDSVASVVIGALLSVVAITLGRENRHLIIGEAADPRLEDAVKADLCQAAGVDHVDEVVSMVLGKGDVLLAARIDLDNSLSADDIEELARRLESEVREKHPFVRHFFLDITGDGATLPDVVS